MIYYAHELTYADSAAPPTEILFYRGVISSFFDVSHPPAGGRLFVTDTTVSALPALAEFTACFSGLNPGKAGVGLMEQEAGSSVLLVLPAGERFKTVEQVFAILETALAHSIRRNGVFVGIGGGVITDMTAFAASIYLRGTELELVPTTLLAMADAAIGGKTGCDFGQYKNMVGSFFPASRVHIAAGLAASLSEKEYLSGLAEVVKTALLYDASLYELLKTERERILNREESLLEKIVQGCVCAKAAVVHEDLKERERRMQLNLGHSFAHALESAAGLGRLSHGEAVAWGIARALRVSAELGLCTAEYEADVTKLLRSYGWETAFCHSALSHLPAAEAAERLLAAMKKDKKNRSASLRLILQRGLTDTIIMEVDDALVLKVLSA